MVDNEVLWRDFSRNGFDIIKKWWKTNFWRAAFQREWSQKTFQLWLEKSVHMHTFQKEKHQDYEQMIDFCVKRVPPKNHTEALKIIAETNAEHLLSYFAPYLKNADVVTVLNRAADYKSWSVVQALKDYDAPQSPINETLEVAASCGNLEVVKALHSNASAHHIGKSLRSAASKGHTAVVSYLLPSCTNETIFPALLSAMKANRKDIVEELAPLLSVEELSFAKQQSQVRDTPMWPSHFEDRKYPSAQTIDIIDRYILRHTLEQQTLSEAPIPKRKSKM